MSTTQASTDGHKVRLGSTVSFTESTVRGDQTFKIVNAYDAKPTEGKLSAESPVGGALLGRRIGDLVEVKVPRGVRLLLIAAIL
jgi:transcription elongation factor GreA